MMNKLTVEDFKNFCEILKNNMEKEQKELLIKSNKEFKEFKESSFGKVYKKLTTEERNKHSLLMLHGQMNCKNNFILMGLEAYNNVKNFENEMILKYG